MNLCGAFNKVHPEISAVKILNKNHEKFSLQLVYKSVPKRRVFLQAQMHFACMHIHIVRYMSLFPLLPRFSRLHTFH